MNDPLVLLLFLATWGGIILLFRRLADDFKKATVRQSEKPAQIDEEFLRITAEVQETVDGLGEAIGKRAEQLRALIAEADSKIEQLAAANNRGTLRSPEPPSTVLPASPAQRRAEPSEPPASAVARPAPFASSVSATVGGPGGSPPGRDEVAKPEMVARGSGGAQRPPAPAEPQPVASGRASAAEVLRLAAEGHDPETIARLTNRGREEVRLLLGTRH